MIDEQIQPEPQQPAAPATSGDDLDALLSQFKDQTTSPPSASELSTASEPAPKPGSDERMPVRKDTVIEDELFGKLSLRELPKSDPRDAAIRQLAQRADASERKLAEIETERLMMQDKEDTERVFKEGDTIVRESGKQLPADYAQDFLLALYRRDPEMQDTWQQRYDSPEAMRKAERMIEKALKQLTARLKEIPDPVATEDREAVTAAVRGASMKAPEEKPPNIQAMSDKELKEHTKAKFGYTPRI